MTTPADPVGGQGARLLLGWSGDLGGKLGPQGSSLCRRLCMNLLSFERGGSLLGKFLLPVLHLLL